MQAADPPGAPETASFSTLVAALRFRAAEQPRRRAYTFLADGEEESGSLDYGELDERARAIAAALRRSCRPGDRALLLYPPGLDFVAAFFGCLYAGVVAVPAYPPRSPRTLPRLQSILADCSPAVALSTTTAGGRVRSWLERDSPGRALPWITTDDLSAGLASEWRDPGLSGTDLAFLQYTSGSTSAPKGVMVSHANLAHNQRVIQAACEHSAESVFVTWLPLYHDLGLIGNLLQATWVGAPCVLMAPVAFLQSPGRWLRAISRYRGTTSGGPNFAYDLCVRKAAELEKLDLSSWRVAFNGAEPVRAATLERFAAAFAPAGFRAASLYPCYGLAEVTLMVSGGHPDSPAVVRAYDAEALAEHRAVAADEGRDVVGCGRVLLDLRVAIADPETGEACPPGRIGEIWVAGGSVAQGYWGKPEETAATFGARLPGDPDSYLRTGDLGFLDAGDSGELFLTGRLKDLIILRGRNHYPQDIEETVLASHPALTGTGAAFAVEEDGEERLVVVQEVERHPGAPFTEITREIAEVVRQAVAREHEAAVHELVLVPPGGVPKTTSGKVQRRACRDLYLRGELRPLGASRAGPSIGVPTEEAAAEDHVDRAALLAAAGEERAALAEAWLRRTFARLARIDAARIDPERPLSGFGLDSLVAVELKNAAEGELGASLSLSALLEGASLAEAARQAADSLAGLHPDAEEIPEVDAGTELPASYGQRSLWFLHRLSPDSAAYNIAGAARLPRPPAAETVRRAFQALVDRHPALRTTFAAGPDGPVQRVHPHREAGFVREDAAGWTGEELRRRVYEEAFRPFDLENGPLLRTALFERDGESVLVVAVHHIAADFWSMAVLARDLEALASGAEPAAGEAGESLSPLSYTAWSRWQERRLAGPAGEKLWDYWRETLVGAPPLDLPADRPRPPVQTFRGTARSARLEAPAAEALRALADAHGCTLFMALLAGFQALLARSSGQDDFLVGSPTSGRSGLGDRLSRLVGYLVNPVALRADLSGDPTVAEALARARAAALAAFEHQDFPFALLAERLQPERDPGRPALVQAMLGLEKAPSPELAPLAAFALGEGGARLQLGPWTLESLPLEPPGAQVDLTLLAAEIPGTGGTELAFSLQVNADLFDSATADRMLLHLGRLLRGMAAAPERRLADIALLSPEERRQVVVEANRTAADYPREEPIHRLFERQAAREPERVALVDGASRLELTYRELNERANRLARHLRKMGVRSETLVGAALERSVEMVVSFLGILKAGGTYLPLDPSHPRERLAAMVEAVGGPLVVSEERFLDRLPPTAGGLLRLDREAKAISAESGENLPGEVPEIAGNGLAYVMFTSGSTGRPKAVGVEHRGVVRLVWNTNYLRFGPDRTFLQLAPASFDAATLEIWGPLLHGGRLVLFPGRAPSLAELDEVVERHGVDTLWLTTALFHQVVDGRIELLARVRDLMTGGEVILPEAVNRVLAEVPGCRLTACYGPTENTTFTTCHEMTAPVPPGGLVPIGRPIANTTVYVVDRALSPVPPGVPGELVTGGDGLARGYLGRPDLTAERFVPAPFCGESEPPGARVYRTGDLVRRRSGGGGLEFLARLDQQVKIRGFRVEPGEVEAALCAHPAVRQATVLARDDGAGSKRLVAYVAGGPRTAELREHLRGLLPEPMIPSAFVLLEALPINAHGKVDRAALARIAPDFESERPYSAPRTPAEEVVAGIWADLLGAGQVGAEDDFFDLGGHSLLATRVLARLREPFGVDLPLAALFARPTVEGLAAAIEEARRATREPVPPPAPLVPVPRTGDLALSFAQERLWFLERLAPGLPVYNIPAALDLNGEVDPAALARALSAVAGRHEALRTVFGEASGQPVQRIQPAAPVPLPVVDLAGLPAALAAAEADRIEAAEARRLFDIEEGPLLRAVLLRAEISHRLLLTIHHIAADGWSLGVLLDELSALYGGADLPELPVQYADFAAWQREALAAVLAPQLAWWRERLAGVPAALDLPADRPRPAAQSFRGGAVPVAVPAALTAGLRALARRQGATLFATVLAGFAALLHRWTRQADLAVGAAVAGRSHPDAEGLIGFFVNTLPLPVRFAGDPGAAALLAQVRDTALDVHDHQDVPFERLVDELQPRRDLSRTPLFQAVLTLQDGPPVTLRLPGSDPAVLRLLPTGTAKFDVTLNLTTAADGGLAGGLEQNADLLDLATAERMAAQFLTLLAAGAANPQVPLSELSLLGEAERAQLLALGAAPGRYPAEAEDQRDLYAIFAAQARRTPDAPALVAAGRAWSYAELAGRAGGLARELRRRGAGPEVRVGVCAERSAELVVGLLAILKAGGTFVPLDPAYPRERLAWLIEDSDAALVLVQDKLRPDLPRIAAPVLSLDGYAAGEAPGEIEEEIPAEILADIPPDCLAYLIYTSGSTGRPKGVAITHANYLPLFLWARGRFRLGPETRVLQTLSPSFDFGLWEVLSTLLAGGTLHAAGNAVASDPARWVAYANAHGINTVIGTPSFFREVTGLGIPVPSLEILHLGGEALLRADARPMLGLSDAGGHCVIYNGYGPTEASVICASYCFDRAEGPAPKTTVGVPIGRPLAEGPLYVVEVGGEPAGVGALAPAGVPGELLIGGTGVGRGYLGRPDLTAERFLPDPFSAEPGARLYRTGDLCRWLSSGDLDYLGRIDQQVKIRGLRVELGEIEAALAAHPAVREAAVVLAAGGTDLFACLVLEGSPEGEAPAPEELRSFLQRRLPAPMVPARYAFLDALPRTPNGKLDRRALAELEAAAESTAERREHEPPATPEEEQIARIWEELLGAGPVGRHDNFFELGGHSLLATRLLSRLKDQLGAELSPRHVFEHPTLAELAEAVQESLAGGAAPAPAAPPLAAVLRPAAATEADGSRRHPLSFAQERLWFLEQINPGTALYNVAVAARTAGPLRPEVLAAALGAVEARQEALRTVFATDQGRPVQRVRPADPRPFPLPLIDLSGLPPARRDTEIDARSREAGRRPFDLERGPLLRTLLFRAAPDDHLFAVYLHHLISDGWSTGVLLRELAAFAAAIATDTPARLPALPLQYGNWAAWQREALSGERLAGQLAWWRERLAGLAPLDLPADRPRPPVLSHRGRLTRVALPADAVAALQARARQEGATAFMVLLAAFQTLLARWCGRFDIAVGSPIANRGDRAVEGLIGLFSNTVVMRTDLSEAPSFRDALARVRETTLGAYAHEETPFAKVVEELQPERDLSRSPLAQTVLVLQNQPWPELRIGDLRLTPFDLDTGVSKFDLTLVFWQECDGFEGVIESSADLFDEATVARFYRHYTALLAAAAKRPETALPELPLLDEAERAQLLDWGRSPGRWEGDETGVYALFARQVRLQPEAPAVIAGSRTLPYAELEREAGRLAAELRRRGVGPEVRVGVCAERSAELVIGLLAVLRAGGVFVPLDPAYPRERLALLVEDSRAALLLAQDRLLADLPAVACPVLSLDRLPASGGQEPAPAAVPPEALAYLIYTSGSTGRPKGVAITHANYLPLCRWAVEHFRLGPHTRTLQTLSPSFDFGLWEVLSTLIAGGTLHAAGRETATDPARWLAYANAHQINTVIGTPSFFREVAGLGRLPSLEILHLGGEALLRADAALMLGLGDAGGHCVIHNGYGPTEATVICATYRFDRTGGPAPAASAGVPIGRPLAEGPLYVVEPSGRLAPAGVPGELLVGGTGVGRGYLGRPDLTAERFLPDPFADVPGARLYRTGDLCRWLSSGDLDYLGRIDQQVKVRGLRVEPGEVEAVLAAHPAVREAAVVTWRGTAGTELFACVVLEDETAPEDLRAWLQQRLPTPMVPSRYAFLEALPRTPNGKLDRRALSAVQPAADSVERPYEAPATPVEELIAGLWQELLRGASGARPVGRHDNFFELGGHSLLATQVLARIQDRFGVELSPRAVFEQPTVAGLAAAVKEAYRRPREPQVQTALQPEDSPAGAAGLYPLSYAQERLWFLEQLDPGTALYNVPVAARAAGPLRPEVLAAALAAVERRQGALRTVFADDAGLPVQVVGPPVGVPLPLIDLSALPPPRRETELAARSQDEARRPFDLERGPLLRTSLYRLGPEDHSFTVVLHHLIADGWSAGVLLRELGAFSSSALQGESLEATPLPRLPLQYGDWAAWERDHLDGDLLAAQLAEWSERLAGLEPLELPGDRPRPAVSTHRGRQSPVALPPATVEALQARARQEGITAFMVLLAAFQTALARWSGQTDLAVASPIANRRSSAVEGLIGLFSNTVVLRTDLSGEPTFRTALARVRDTTLDAYAHEETPFAKVVEALRPERDLSRAPLAQVMLVLQNQPWPELRIGGLRLAPADLDTGLSKLDLTLVFWDKEGGEMGGLVESSADLFDLATVERFFAGFRTLLEAGARQPETRISELPLLGDAERAELLAWSREAGPWDAVEGEALHTLFERQARRTPDAPAVAAGGRSWSYAELDRWAGRVAAELRRRGVGLEDRVALAAEPSPELVAGQLGVLKSGAALVPLDPASLPDRLRWMLGDAGAKLVLLQSGLAADLPEVGPPVLNLDRDGQDRLPASEPFLPAVPSGALAWLIYTSGSTGVPKGTGIAHGNAASLFHWSREHFGLGSHTRVLLTLAPAFDFSLFEVLSTLTAGGVLHAEGAAVATDPVRWAAHAREHRINTVHVTPSFFREVAGIGVALPAIEILHLGAEALFWADIEKLRGVVAPGCAVFNGYGPTEVAISAVMWQVDRNLVPAAAAAAGIPIGRPTADRRLYVAEPGPGWSLSPAGVPGELCLGGPGVGRGYPGRPDLTAERFVPDPFGGEPGGRLYRTGDRVRWLKNGLVEFLGRLDQQVKVRGLRVEPGEVEAALLDTSGVREAAVVVQAGPRGNELLACVVPDGEPSALEDLRAALLRRLPAGMVPSRFAFLEALPRTANGKLDRRALAALQPATPDRGYEPPAGAVEEQIAEVWREVLPDGAALRIGRFDDFFDLGGHSLLATRVLTRLRDHGVELSPRDLFERPTVAGLARLAEERGGTSWLSLAETALAAEAPLSFSQERLWFLEQLEPGTALYNMPAVARTSGPLRPEILAAALAALEERHATLRTVFGVREDLDARPVQIVRPPQGIPLPQIDLSALPPALREAELNRNAGTEIRRPFDLERGPLVRAALLRLGREDHALVLNLHHIISDGWSTGVCLRELTALYEAALTGVPARLAPLPIQYAQWAAWQRAHLAGERLAAQLAWWRERLSGLQPLDLVTDRPRPAQATHRGRQLTFELPPAVTARLQAASRQERATPFMLLLAAFQAVLGRYTGQGDLGIGTPVANRSRSDVEGLIGLFVNTVVLRTDLGGDPSFRAALGRVRESTLGAYAHEETPFEKVVEELQPERDLSRSPLFQAMLVLQNQPLPELRIGSLVLVPWDLHTGIAKFDVTVVWREHHGRLVGAAEVNADLFDEATLDRLCEHFRILLTAALERPETPLSELPLLDAEERAQLLAWSRSRTPGRYGTAPTVHALFERQARRTPEATALISQDRAWTYAELDRAADLLARGLRRRGAGPESRIGLCAGRSAELAVGMLAILKAGAAFVPLDPGYPRERLALLAADSGALLILAEEGAARDLPADGVPALPLAVLDLVPDLVPAEPLEPVEIPPGALAYLIYTSGSTGRPKAVALSHANAVPLLEWSLEYFGMGPHTRVLQTLSPAFDFGVWEVLTTLLAGGTLHAQGRDVATDPERWATYAAAHAINTVHATPSFFREVAGLGGASGLGRRLPAVEVLHLGGEALLWEDAGRLLAASGDGCVLYNGYGPTEATVNCSIFRADHRPGGGAGVPIGRPSAENTLYVLEPGGSLAPSGVPGELCVGGPGVARGYLGRPDLTAARFVPDPFGALRGEAGGRLYRTGDRVRWASGNIEFLGRLDQQVKLRGFRIELGEIEATLLAHPAVREAAVVLRDGPAGPELFACAVPRPEAAARLDTQALRAFLAERLPGPMVPSQLAFPEALPRTPNGKLDRRALAGLTPATVSREHHPPATEMEMRIAAIWQEVLRTERIGRDDSFFELGGHSLLATQVLTRLRHALNAEIPLRLLFENATLEGLAAAVERFEAAPLSHGHWESAGELASALPSAVPALLPERASAPVLARRDWPGPDRPVSFPQERLWFLEQLEPGTPRYNTLTGVRLSGRLDPAALAGTLREIVRRHEVLRSTFAYADGRTVQRVKPAEDRAPSLLWIDLSGLPEEPRGREAVWLGTVVARQPFDLETGPLLRPVLLRLAETEHDFLLIVHHIISDGWSMSVLVREVSLLYAAMAEGREARPSPLPEPALQYGDFAAWQRERLRGAYLEEQLRYWRFKLTGAPPVLELPADRPRPAVRSGRGGAVPLRLSAETLAALLAPACKAGLTLFMSLLAAFQALLYRYTGCDDILVGTPIANREARELEGLIGLFVNTLVMRTRLDGDPTFTELVARAADTALEAYTHQSLPFEKLVETLAPERSAVATPLVQVLLVLQNTPMAEAELPGLRLTQIPLDSEAAKLDLTVALQEVGGELYGRWGYDADLFEPATAARMAGHFQTLLDGAAADPGRPISELPLLTPAERQAVLVDWAGEEGHPLPPGAPLTPGLVLGHAAGRPDAVAVSWEGGELTYGDLERRSRPLARRLRDLGVGPEVRVGLLAGRSAEQVTGMLAILRAGGVYVPLDPGYPAPRIAAMIEDAGVRVLVGPREPWAALPEALRAIPWIDLDAAVRVDELQAPTDFEEADLDRDHLAYVIFTSGSTGRPKGVGVPHGALRNRLVAAQAVLPLAEDDAVLQIAPLGFDFSVWELLAPLAFGARLVLARPGEQQDPESLARTLGRQRVTVAHFVPSMLEVFLGVQVDQEGRTPLRLVYSGGEALSPALRDRFYARFGPEVRLVNQYGPTEATIDVTWHPVPPALSGKPEASEASVPIGRAFAGCTLRVLDRDLAPAPQGVPAELALGGPCLARGYLGQPAWTAERFVPDPVGPPGARLYRTGDLAQWLEGGDLAYLGRIDGQVKVRGVRIEPGEIEAALLRQPGVRQAAVLLRDGLPGGPALVAYLVGTVPDETTLRAGLRQSLPPFLVPAYFVVLDALPLTPAGKLDRQALPLPGSDLRDRPDGSFAAPRTALEASLAEVWSAVLQREAVGVHDNFFEIGGHSLLAIQVLSRLKDALGVELPVRVLFESPTVAELAAALVSSLAEGAEDAELDQLLAELELEELPEEAGPESAPESTNHQGPHESVPRQAQAVVSPKEG